MTEDAKIDWLTAAWGTLNGIPADLLKMGCAVARRWCDHPSKIVPQILREVEPIWQQRRTDKGRVLAAIDKMKDDPLPKEQRCTPEQAERIRKECGIKYEDERDGSTMFKGSDEMRRRMAELDARKDIAA